MTQLKHICGTGAVLLLVILPIFSICAAVTLSSAALAATNSIPALALQSRLSFAVQARVFRYAPAFYLDETRFIIAQSEIPDVLTPSTVPSAGPPLFVSSPTAQPTIASGNVSTNTASESTGGNSISLEKIVGSISPLFIIALIPLLFVIGALFYFFFMGDQDRAAADKEQQIDAEANNTDQDTGWREL